MNTADKLATLRALREAIEAIRDEQARQHYIRAIAGIDVKARDALIRAIRSRPL